MQRHLLFLVATLLTRLVHAQSPLTSRDSVALTAAIVADLRASYTAFASGHFIVDTAAAAGAVVNGRFVRDTSRASVGPWARRILALLQRPDTAGAAVPARTMARVQLAAPRVSGDTAALVVTVNQCHSPERVAGSLTTHRYVRRGNRWETVSRGESMVGDGLRCPY